MGVSFVFSKLAAPQQHPIVTPVTCLKGEIGPGGLPLRDSAIDDIAPRRRLRAATSPNQLAAHSGHHPLGAHQHIHWGQGLGGGRDMHAPAAAAASVDAEIRQRLAVAHLGPRA